MTLRRAARPLTRLLSVAGMAVLMGAGSGAFAHQLKVATTTVLFNDRSARLEVMHRFYLHDAEQVAGEIAGRGANLLENTEDRQRFGIYVHERFSLTDAEGGTLPLTLRGT